MRRWWADAKGHPQLRPAELRVTQALKESAWTEKLLHTTLQSAAAVLPSEVPRHCRKPGHPCARSRGFERGGHHSRKERVSQLGDAHDGWRATSPSNLSGCLQGVGRRTEPPLPRLYPNYGLQESRLRCRRRVPGNPESIQV